MEDLVITYNAYMTKDEAILEVQRLIEQFGLTLKDYKPHPSKGTTLEPKYFGPRGQTWAGRGKAPKWFKGLVK